MISPAPRQASFPGAAAKSATSAAQAAADHRTGTTHRVPKQGIVLPLFFHSAVMPVKPARTVIAFQNRQVKAVHALFRKSAGDTADQLRDDAVAATERIDMQIVGEWVSSALQRGKPMTRPPRSATTIRRPDGQVAHRASILASSGASSASAGTNGPWDARQLAACNARSATRSVCTPDRITTFISRARG